MKTEESFTTTFHNDKRPTVVEVEGKIYNLTPMEITLKDLLKEKDFNKLPHVRHLNPIEIRSLSEQEKHNKDAEIMHLLYHQIPQTNTKITSIKKAALVGADIPKEVERLLKEKEEALKKGDTSRAKSIRKQLRNLDYKRYITTE